MPTAGHKVGRYTLVEQLGGGGYATVWSAVTPDGAEVAIKLLHDHLVDHEGRGGPSPAERFLAEARLLQRLDHPGMLQVMETIEDRGAGIIAFAMERLVGSDLYTLSRTEVLEIPLMLEVLAQVARTLGHLHDHGVVHRDVKQSNIFVCDADRRGLRPISRLLDFGIAKQADEESEIAQTRQGELVGTLHLLAPEVLDRAEGKQVELTGAVDQWGLGVVLYKCLTGKFPFSGDDYPTLITMIRRWPPPMVAPKPRFGWDRVPGVLDNIIRRTLAKRPDGRYSSAHRLADRLLAARDEICGDPRAMPLIDDSATALVWSGPRGPIDLAALPAHQGTVVTSLGTERPTIPEDAGMPAIDAPETMNLDAPLAPTIGAPQAVTVPARPRLDMPDYSTGDDHMSATVVDKDQQIDTSTLVPTVEVADTRIVPQPRLQRPSSLGPRDTAPIEFESAPSIEISEKIPVDPNRWMFLAVCVIVAVGLALGLWLS